MDLADKLEELGRVLYDQYPLQDDERDTIRRAVEALRAIASTSECYSHAPGGWACWLCNAPDQLGKGFVHEAQCPIRIAKDGVPRPQGCREE